MRFRSAAVRIWLACFTLAALATACGDQTAEGPATGVGDGLNADGQLDSGLGDGLSGETVQDADITGDQAANTAPTITIALPKDGTTITLGESVDVEAKVADAEDKATDLDVVCKADGITNPIFTGKGSADAKVTFQAKGLPPGKQKVTCTVTDSGGLTATASVSVYVNTAPGAPTVEITPNQPKTTDALTAKVVTDAVDADRKPSELTYEYVWLKDGKPTQYTGATLPAGVAKKGETWTVQVSAKDPFAMGVPGQAQVTIQDSAPGAAELAIAPTPVDLLTEVTCTLAKAASDVDDDTLTYSYTWAVNGAVDASATTASVSVSTLQRADGSAVHKGDKLTCSAQASDGTLSGAQATSPEVVVIEYNVCGSSLNPCDGNATCTGTDTLDVQCACKPGYSGDGKSCTDIDECTAGTAGCDLAASCTNTAGSFTCTCNPGFSGDGKACVDIDECGNGTAVCDLAATCTNTVGSYGCVCNAGFSGDGKTCTDVDECGNGTAVCDLSATCTNTVGSYGCVCNAGFSGDGKICTDIDECGNGTAVCDLSATCTNTVGSYGCACKPGYSGDGKTCTDVNECGNGSAGCDLAAVCANTVGAYTCTCKPGYSGDGKTCTDVDECGNGTAVCDLAATCTNTVGAYTCACKPGFVGDGKTCTDVNECKVGAGGMGVVIPVGLAGWDVTGTSATVKWQQVNGILYYGDPVKKTYDTPGVANKGYAITPPLVVPNVAGVALAFDVTLDVESGGNYDRFTVEIAAGATPTVLYAKGSTVGTQVQHISVPLTAYAGKTVTLKFNFDTSDSIGNSTTGIGLGNLSMGGPTCGANAVCSNLPGSFTCACATGFTGNGQTCTDVNECATNNGGCDANAACSNTPGSFSCACKQFYQGDGKTCADIDECKTSNGGCGATTAYACTNNVGAAPTCKDLDECKTGTAACDLAATCTNTVGSFVCACKAGYSGDGKTCSDVNECNGAPSSTSLTPGLAGWTVAGSSTAVKWQVSGTTLVYQDAIKGTYDNGSTNSGTVTSPPIAIDASNKTLTFTLRSAFESYSGADKLLLQVIPAGGSAVTIGDKTKLPGGNATTTYLPFTFDLSAYVGKTVQLRFSFDTVDSFANGFAGPSIDKLALSGTVQACDSNAACTNSVGSYTCACKTGYSGDGKTCADVNECTAGTAGCSTNATCGNTTGSFTCTCNAGYAGDGKTCTDVNECTAGTAVCAPAADCSNTTGSYTCACKAGYTGDGKTCTDVDECKATTAYTPDFSTSLSSWVVTASDASVKWQASGGKLVYGNPATGNYNSGNKNSGTVTSPSLSLPAGVTGTTLAFSLKNDVESDPDFDKLTVEVIPAGGTAVTIGANNLFARGNTFKDYAINLDAYAGKNVQIRFSFDTGDSLGNGTSGIALDKVTVNKTAPCNSNGSCSNTVGSYTCACNTGYAGDGKTCADVDECATGKTKTADFTSGLDNFVVTGSSTTVRWQASKGLLYYGNPAANNYATSTAANSGIALSPAVLIEPGTTGNALTFSLKLDTEASNLVDKLTVSIVSGGVTTVLADKSKFTAGTTFKDYSFSLDAFVGKVVQVQFAFDTVDGMANTGSGVFIDKLGVKTVGPCDGNATCTNTVGSYTCACKTGYLGNGTVCVSPGSAGNPATTCASILGAVPTAASGVYSLDLDGSGPIAAFDGYCDMTTAGGGWLLVGQQVPGQVFADTNGDFQLQNAGTLDKTFRLGNAKAQAGAPSVAWRITSTDTSGKLVDDAWFKPACNIDWLKYVGVNGSNTVDDLNCGRAFTNSTFATPISANTGAFNCSKGIGQNNGAQYCSIRMGTCGFGGYAEGQAMPCNNDQFSVQTVRLWKK
jgi:hypothetical protein